MMQNRRGKAALLAGFLLIIPLLGCDDSETIPPTGSTITVAGNPATIVLGSQGEIGSSEIIATVRSELGIALPGQDVRFSASAGGLFFVGTNPLDPANSAANIPIETDSLGNAIVTLFSDTTTIVTATSGNTTGTLTLNTVIGNLSNIILSFDPLTAGCADSTTLDLCSAKLCLAARAQESDGTPLDGVAVSFQLRDLTSTSGNTWSGSFFPSQGTTGVGSPTPPTGVVETEFRPDETQCLDACRNPDSCTANIVAISGAFTSAPLNITINARQ